MISCYCYNAAQVRASIPNDDSKQQQNSVDNIPHLLSRLRGLGSSSVEATHVSSATTTGSVGSHPTINTSSHTSTSAGDLLTMWTISSRNRRNSDGDRHLYSHDGQSQQLNVNEMDDDSTASYGHQNNNNNNNNSSNNNSINNLSKFSYFVRVEVSALSHYKICTADPQGDESIDNWAEVSGNFSQSFFLDLETCRLAMTDRLITIDLTERPKS